jgi:hypothetical protein
MKGQRRRAPPQPRELERASGVGGLVNPVQLSSFIQYNHVMSCHVMSCRVVSCHVMSCHVMLYWRTSYGENFVFIALPILFGIVWYVFSRIVCVYR